MPGCRCSVEEPPHRWQVTDRHVIRIERVVRRPTVGVRVVRPDVELGLVVTRRLRLRAIRHAEQVAHELERMDAVLVAHRTAGRVVYVATERREPSRDHDVVAVNGVHSSRHGVDHVAIPAGRNDPSIVMLRHQLNAEVRLVPHLPVPHPRQTSIGPAVPSSKCRRKVRKRRRARSDRSDHWAVASPRPAPTRAPLGRIRSGLKPFALTARTS